ncbi:MAG: chlorite dismutase family protein [Deltaproteobacteria bacterium]|nr:chlorite dismutase family protein [Deltaproteobacteria bacterium]
MFKKTIALIGIQLLFVIFLINGVNSAEMKSGEMMAPMMIDKAKILADTGVFGTFAMFKLDHAWNQLDSMTKQKAAQEVKDVFTAHQNRVAVDTYLTRGLSEKTDFFLRIHSYELINNQNFITDLMATTMGKYLTNTDTFVGITKALNYATKPEMADQLPILKAGKPESPRQYVIVIPTRKDSKWWNTPVDGRTRMIKEHTAPTLAFLNTVQRKLYHSTGLDDLDFITYFETNRLDNFNNLVIGLRTVEEDNHNKQYGSPTVLGTIRSLDEILAILSK